MERSKKLARLTQIKEKNKKLTVFFQPVEFLSYNDKEVVLEAEGFPFTFKFHSVNSYGKRIYEGRGGTDLFIAPDGKCSFGITMKIAHSIVHNMEVIRRDGTNLIV